MFVRHEEQTVVGSETMLSVDTRKAGWGELSIKVESANNKASSGKPIPVKIDERGDGIYKVSFVPDMADKYLVFVTFNQQPIKDSPVAIYAELSHENKENFPNLIESSRAERKIFSNGQVTNNWLLSPH